MFPEDVGKFHTSLRPWTFVKILARGPKSLQIGIPLQFWLENFGPQEIFWFVIATKPQPYSTYPILSLHPYLAPKDLPSFTLDSLSKHPFRQIAWMNLWPQFPIPNFLRYPPILSWFSQVGISCFSKFLAQKFDLDLGIFLFRWKFSLVRMVGSLFVVGSSVVDSHTSPFLCVDGLNCKGNGALISQRNSIVKTQIYCSFTGPGRKCRLLPNAKKISRKQQKGRRSLVIVNELAGQYEDSFEDVKTVRNLIKKNAEINFVFLFFVFLLLMRSFVKFLFHYPTQ